MDIASPMFDAGLSSKWIAQGWGESRAAENCGTWLKYCDVHGKIRMRSSGKMRVQAEECLDASLLSVASCISDLQSCMYASATGGRANITDFEVKVSHLEGDRLCAIAGITEDYVNDLLKDERAAFEEKLNSVCEGFYLAPLRWFLYTSWDAFRRA